MKTYKVTTLVHLHREVYVQADSEEEAQRRAVARMEFQYLNPALVDPINVEEA